MLVLPNQPENEAHDRYKKAEDAPADSATFRVGLLRLGRRDVLRFRTAIRRGQRVVDALNKVVAIGFAGVRHCERGRHFAVVEVENGLDYATAMRTFCKHANKVALEVERDLPLHAVLAAKRTRRNCRRQLVLRNQTDAVTLSLKFHIFLS